MDVNGHMSNITLLDTN